MQFKENSIYIIGGGPAGLAAAISAHDYAAKVCADRKLPMPQIFILEKNNKLGQSILRTGNGRCNFSNANISAEEKFSKFNHPDFVEKVNAATGKANPVSAFFDKLGLGCQVKQGGMMFPYTNKASSVVDVLRFAITERDIQVCTEVDNDEIKHLINIATKSDPKNYAFVFATGGEVSAIKKMINLVYNTKTEEKSSSDIKFSPTKKVLGPIKTENKYLKTLDGTRGNVMLSLTANNKKVFAETGEILFRKYGVSGIVAFNASRFLYDSNYELIIDFFPHVKKEELSEEIFNRAKNIFANSSIADEKNTKTTKQNHTTITRTMAGLLLPNISEAVLKNANIQDQIINEDNNLRSQSAKAAEAFKNFILKEAEIADPKQCQVSRGGIATEEIEPKTMQLTKCKNVYVAGEVLDIDGPCGGYNLHWAWLSGIVAGRAATAHLLK